MYEDDRTAGSSRSGSRIYVGNLPADFTEKDVEREFERFGRIVKLEFKRTVSGAGYCFLEYADPRDARDAIAELHGRPPPGTRDAAPLRVELPLVRGARPPDRVQGRSEQFVNKGLPRRGRYIVEIRGLPPSGSWQDLKDHFRGVGDVGYSQVRPDPDAPEYGIGEVSFFTRHEMLDAVELLDGSTFRSHEGEKARISVREKRLVESGRSDDEYEGGAYSSSRRSPGRSSKYGNHGSNGGSYAEGPSSYPRADTDPVYEPSNRGRTNGGPYCSGGYHPRGPSTSPPRGYGGYSDRRGRSRSRDRGALTPMRGGSGGYGSYGPPSTAYYEGPGTNPRDGRPSSLERGGGRRYDDWIDRRR
ncbi:rna recognition motif-containing protein [Cystoisospora suis]|uniref:Rna recognition motif-containing protein n=1 Tax=Cystoisospora suis TaxID=483139 RepID=A0A2C6LDP1_9APIC|nr:rna recognition motif-containing protein [Cystoisospora suis]